MKKYFINILNEEPLSDLSLNDLKGGASCGVDECTFDCPKLTNLCTSENALLCSCNSPGAQNTCPGYCPSNLGPKPFEPIIDDCSELINRP